MFFLRLGFDQDKRQLAGASRQTTSGGDAKSNRPDVDLVVPSAFVCVGRKGRRATSKGHKKRKARYTEQTRRAGRGQSGAA